MKPSRTAGIAAILMLLAPATTLRLRAQSMDDLNIQIHGYATQGFLYTNHNSWNSTDSDNGSAAWTEAVVNVSAQPESRLRIGMQARYYLLGDYGNQIKLDWAQADYKFNDYLGFRVGDVKTPFTLFNEVQDIDPAYLFALLPQSVYPIASRDSLLSHFGGVVYGAVPLGERSKIEYRAYGGTRIISGDDSLFQPLRDLGFTVPNGTRGPLYGTQLRWHTPLPGLMFGATMDIEHLSGEITYGPLSGTTNGRRSYSPTFFGTYEKGKLMLAGEYVRALSGSAIQFPAMPPIPDGIDYRCWYAMATYKVSAKLSAGAYYSSFMDRAQPVGSSRFQKDWTIAARYDFNPYLYAKAAEGNIVGHADGQHCGLSAEFAH